MRFDGIVIFFIHCRKINNQPTCGCSVKVFICKHLKQESSGTKFDCLGNYHVSLKKYEEKIYIVY